MLLHNNINYSDSENPGNSKRQYFEEHNKLSTVVKVILMKAPISMVLLRVKDPMNVVRRAKIRLQLRMKKQLFDQSI